MPLPQNLREPRPGDPIKAAEYAALVRGMKLALSNDRGIQDAITKLRPPPSVPGGRRHLWVRTANAIPAYSVFGICKNRALAAPADIDVDMIGSSSSGSPFLLLTNDSVAIPAGGIGLAYPIDYYEAMTLNITDLGGGASAVIPGNPCGPHSDNWGITADACGFVAMCDPDAASNVLVMRTREPIALIAKVVDVDIASGTTGTVKVSSKAGDALEPKAQASPWKLKVTNLTQRELLVGEDVIVHDTTYFNLIAQPMSDGFEYGELGGDLGSGAAVHVTWSLTWGSNTPEVYGTFVPTGWHIPSGTLVAGFFDLHTNHWLAMVVNACLVMD